MAFSNKHTFALYHQELPTSFLTILKINSKELWHRLTHVLRLDTGEPLILFNGTRHLNCLVHEDTYLHKNSVTLQILSFNKSIGLTPPITLYQCLTKKSAFEDIIYIAAALGVSSIVPVITQKTDRSWWHVKTLDRLHSIMISACEQSKNFILPLITEPQPFQSILQPDPTALKIVFDPTGKNFGKVLGQHHDNQMPLKIIIGPEGGLVEQELTSLDDAQFISCKLTNTILRSVDAATVALGFIRTFTA